MKEFLATLLLAGSVLSANAQTPAPLLDIERELDLLCRGSSGDAPATDQICKLRDKVAKVLQGIGYCYGRKGQTGAEMQWHKCARDSLRS